MLPQLTAAAAHQLGLFTAAQARAAGYTNAERRARLKQGDWQVLRRGIYAERQTVLAVATSPYGRHRLEAWRACSMSCSSTTGSRLRRSRSGCR